MAYVYEASHLRIPKRFAVKFLKLSLVNNSEALLRFRREAEIIATLDHPNIVNLVDYNVSEDGVPYIVMEFLDGEHLGVRLERGPVPIGEALKITGAVVAALTAAHAREIIHRDLKPENIILCKGDVVKVVDFGVAKLRGGADLTAFNTILGTVAYMAPEQITAKAVDSRTDQYALATIFYELLSGQRPDEPKTVAEQAMKILYGQPAPLENVPAGVNEVLFRAMAKNSLERYATVNEFYESLAAVIAVPRGESASAQVIDELPPLAGDATTITMAPAVPEDAGDLSAEVVMPPLAPAPPPSPAQAVTPPSALPPPVAIPPAPPLPGMRPISSHAVTMPPNAASQPTLVPPSGAATPPSATSMPPVGATTIPLSGQPTLPPIDVHVLSTTELALKREMVMREALGARPTETMPVVTSIDDPAMTPKSLPALGPPPSPGTTLPPRTTVRDFDADGTAETSRPGSTTLRGGKVGALPLWLWFAVGLLASGGLVTAVWLLIGRR